MVSMAPSCLCAAIFVALALLGFAGPSPKGVGRATSSSSTCLPSSNSTLKHDDDNQNLPSSSENTVNDCCDTHYNATAELEQGRPAKRLRSARAGVEVTDLDLLLDEALNILEEIRRISPEEKALAVAQVMRSELLQFATGPCTPSARLRADLLKPLIDGLEGPDVAHSAIWAKSYRRWITAWVTRVYQHCEARTGDTASGRTANTTPLENNSEVVTLVGTGAARGRGPRRVGRTRSPHDGPVGPAGPRSHHTTESFVFFNPGGEVLRSIHPPCSGEPRTVQEAVGLICGILGLEEQDPDPLARPSFVPAATQNNLQEAMCCMSADGQALMHQALGPCLQRLGDELEEVMISARNRARASSRPSNPNPRSRTRDGDGSRGSPGSNPSRGTTPLTSTPGGASSSSGPPRTSSRPPTRPPARPRSSPSARPRPTSPRPRTPSGPSAANASDGADEWVEVIVEAGDSDDELLMQLPSGDYVPGTPPTPDEAPQDDQHRRPSRSRSRSPATMSNELMEVVGRWWPAAELRLHLLQNCGGGNQGLVRCLRGLADHRGVRSYADHADALLRYLETQVRDPMDTEDRVDDREFALWLEQLLWDDWTRARLPEPGTPAQFVGIFGAVDGIRPGDQGYVTLQVRPVADLSVVPSAGDQAEASETSAEMESVTLGETTESSAQEGMEGSDAEDTSLMTRSRSPSRPPSSSRPSRTSARSPVGSGGPCCVARQGVGVEDVTAVAEDALHEISVCLSQLDDVGQEALAGAIARELSEVLTVPRGHTYVDQCYRSLVERALVTCAWYTSQYDDGTALSDEWQETVRILEMGIHEAASMRARGYYRYCALQPRRQGSVETPVVQPEYDEDSTLMQMFAAAVAPGSALTQVVQGLDLRLAQMETAARVRRALRLLHQLRGYYKVEASRRNLPEAAEGLEASLAAHSCADGGNDTVSELDSADLQFVEGWWGQVQALLPAPRASGTAAGATQVDSSQLVSESDDSLPRSHAETEAWLEREELRRHEEDAQRMEEYWQEQEALAMAGAREREQMERQAAFAAQSWDDWALHS